MNCLIGMAETRSHDPPTPRTPHIVTVEKPVQEPIDEHNPIVQDLKSAGYTVKKSVEAVTQYSSLEAALEHLVRETGDEEGEAPLIPEAKFSRENSEAETFKLKWLVCM